MYNNIHTIMRCKLLFNLQQLMAFFNCIFLYLKQTTLHIKLHMQWQTINKGQQKNTRRPQSAHDKVIIMTRLRRMPHGQHNDDQTTPYATCHIQTRRIPTRLACASACPYCWKKKREEDPARILLEALILTCLPQKGKGESENASMEKGWGMHHAGSSLKLCKLNTIYMN